MKYYKIKAVNPTKQNRRKFRNRLLFAGNVTNLTVHGCDFLSLLQDGRQRRIMSGSRTARNGIRCRHTMYRLVRALSRQRRKRNFLNSRRNK